MAFAELARAEAHLGERVARARFEQAVELANAEDEVKPLTLGGPSARFLALKRIGERMSDAGFGEMALALATSLAGETNDEWRALRACLIGTVASHGLRKGTLDHKRAEGLFAEALASARRARNSMIGPAWQLGALLQVADRLAEAGRLRAAFEALGLAHFTVDPFVIGLTAWADALERRVVGLSLSVIIAVAEIFGWQRPDWKAIAEAITGASS